MMHKNWGLTFNTGNRLQNVFIYHWLILYLQVKFYGKHLNVVTFLQWNLIYKYLTWIFWLLKNERKIGYSRLVISEIKTLWHLKVTA